MINKFKTELLNVDISTRTINSYITDIEQFVKWFNLTYDKKFNNEISDKNVKEYINFLLDIKKYSTSSVVRKLSTIKRFNNFLIVNGFSNLLSAKTINKLSKMLNARFANNVDKNRRVKIIPNEDLDKLVKTINKKSNKRDIAIFQILFNTGIRVDELVNIELDDIKIPLRSESNNYSYLVVRSRKTYKRCENYRNREIPLNKSVEIAINDYLKVRTHVSDKKLFLGQRGPITRTTINRLLKEYCYDAGIELLSPYVFRYTFCSNLINKDIPVTLISELLGHRSAETMLSYTMETSTKDIEKYKAILGKLLHE